MPRGNNLNLSNPIFSGTTAVAFASLENNRGITGTSGISGAFPALGTFATRPVVGTVLLLPGAAMASGLTASALGCAGNAARTFFGEFWAPSSPGDVPLFGFPSADGYGPGLACIVQKTCYFGLTIDDWNEGDPFIQAHDGEGDHLVRFVLSLGGTSARFHTRARRVSDPGNGSWGSVISHAPTAHTYATFADSLLSINASFLGGAGDGGGVGLAYMGVIAGKAVSQAEATSILTDPEALWGTGELIPVTRRLIVFVTAIGCTPALPPPPSITWATHPTGGAEGTNTNASINVVSLSSVWFDVLDSGDAVVTTYGPVAPISGVATQTIVRPLEGAGYRARARNASGSVAALSNAFGTNAAGQAGDTIETITIANDGTTAGTLNQGYTSFGMVFHQGELPEGMALEGEINGNTYPVQTNVMTTWPDGSAKFADCAMWRPTALTQGQSHSILLRTASPPVPSGTNHLSAALAATGATTLQMVYSSPAGLSSSNAIYNLKALAQAAISNGNIDYWRQGNLCWEGRFQINVPGCALRIVADVCGFANGDLIWDIQWNNDRTMEATVHHGKIAYTATVVMNGAQVLSESIAHHYQYTSWHRRFHVGNSGGLYFQQRLNIRTPPQRLIDTHVAPPYDLTIAPNALTQLYSDVRAAHNATWGQPLRLNGLRDWMGAAGGHPTIAYTSAPCTLYLYTRSIQSVDWMMEWAEQHGNYPGFMWDETNREWINPARYKVLWPTEQYRDRPLGTAGDYNASNTTQYPVVDRPELGENVMVTIEASHVGDMFAIPYAVSGQRWMLDRMFANIYALIMGHIVDVRVQEAYGNAFDSGKALLGTIGQVRASAWLTRNALLAGWLGTDGRWETTYMRQVLTESFDSLYDQCRPFNIARWPAVLHGLHPMEGASPEEAHGVWQLDFFAYAMTLAARHGYDKARQYMEYQWNFNLVRYETNDWNWKNSITAHLKIGPSWGQWYTSWGAIQTAQASYWPGAAPALGTGQWPPEMSDYWSNGLGAVGLQYKYYSLIGDTAKANRLLAVYNKIRAGDAGVPPPNTQKIAYENRYTGWATTIPGLYGGS